MQKDPGIELTLKSSSLLLSICIFQVRFWLNIFWTRYWTFVCQINQKFIRHKEISLIQPKVFLIQIKIIIRVEFDKRVPQLNNLNLFSFYFKCVIHCVSDQKRHLKQQNMTSWWLPWMPLVTLVYLTLCTTSVTQTCEIRIRKKTGFLFLINGDLLWVK